MTKKRAIPNPDTGKPDFHTVDISRKASRSAIQDKKYVEWLNKGTKTHPYKAAEILALLQNEQRSQKGLNTVTEPLHQSLSLPVPYKKEVLRTKEKLLPVLVGDGRAEGGVPFERAA